MKTRWEELLEELQQLFELWVKKTYVANKLGVSRQLIEHRKKAGYVTPYYHDKVQTYLYTRANQKLS